MIFYKKKGQPEVGDIVLCTVKKILYHSVFVSLDEYENKEGMVHISEIAPGRIRNLRDYVKEGKRIVCKVIDIKKERGHIDLSLRRTPKNSMINKLNAYKQEEKAEKLLEMVGKQFKKDLKAMYKEVGYKAIEEYDTLYNFFQSMVTVGKEAVEGLDIPKEYKEALYKIAVDKIKPVELKVSGTLKLKSYGSEGINLIKKVLLKVEKGGVQVQYLGAPNYKLEVTGKDYKSVETVLKKAVEQALQDAKKLGGEAEFSKHGN